MQILRKFPLKVVAEDVFPDVLFDARRIPIGYCVDLLVVEDNLSFISAEECCDKLCFMMIDEKVMVKIEKSGSRVYAKVFSGKFPALV